MTFEEAKIRYRDLEVICEWICSYCTAEPDGYCTGGCDVLNKIRQMPLEKLQRKIAEHDEDYVKVVRYVKQYKLNPVQRKKKDRKAYQHEYYLRVTKPKRQMKKTLEDKK